MHKFSIIYVDCPWRYGTKNPAKYGGATYPTMTVEELSNLPVHLIADRDCALFFWVTYPLLEEGLEVIKAWGFRYRTVAFTWVKTNRVAGTYRSGLGHWTNPNAELCLFAKKGHPKRIAKNIKELVVAPVTRHSAKPPEVRDRIIQLVGDLPKIELFARERTPGWVCLGNELDGLDIREALHQLISMDNP
jgi:N6-adenosine-specific RNA methylase IME4